MKKLLPIILVLAILATSAFAVGSVVRPVTDEETTSPVPEITYVDESGEPIATVITTEYEGDYWLRFVEKGTEDTTHLVPPEDLELVSIDNVDQLSDAEAEAYLAAYADVLAEDYYIVLYFFWAQFSDDASDWYYRYFTVEDLEYYCPYMEDPAAGFAKYIESDEHVKTYDEDGNEVYYTEDFEMLFKYDVPEGKQVKIRLNGIDIPDENVYVGDGYIGAHMPALGAIAILIEP